MLRRHDQSEGWWSGRFIFVSSIVTPSSPGSRVPSFLGFSHLPYNKDGFIFDPVRDVRVECEVIARRDALTLSQDGLVAPDSFSPTNYAIWKSIRMGGWFLFWGRWKISGLPRFTTDTTKKKKTYMVFFNLHTFILHPVKPLLNTKTIC